MKKSFLSIAAIALLCASCGQSSTNSDSYLGGFSVQDPIRLYEGAAPGSEDWKDNEITTEAMGMSWTINVSNPTIQAYLPDPEKATGAAMIVCPGGGFTMLSIDKEGWNVAEWFAEHGIAAFVLKYRINYTYETAEEASKAITESFSAFHEDSDKPTTQAEKRGSDSETSSTAEKAKSDFSSSDVHQMAGDDARKAIEYVRAHADEYGIKSDKIGIIGFSAGSFVTYNVAFNHTAESRPDLVAPIYGSCFYGSVPEDPAPLFIAAPEFDAFGEPTSFDIYSRYHQNGLVAELHYFANTFHGFGVKDDGEPVNNWIGLLYNFMIKNGFIEGDYLLLN